MIEVVINVNKFIKNMLMSRRNEIFEIIFGWRILLGIWIFCVNMFRDKFYDDRCLWVFYVLSIIKNMWDLFN